MEVGSIFCISRNYLAGSSSSTSTTGASTSVSCSPPEILTTYNQQGFLTTVTIPAGASVSYDSQGFPITRIAPAYTTHPTKFDIFSSSAVETLGVDSGHDQTTAFSAAAAPSSAVVVSNSMGGVGRLGYDGVFGVVALAAAAIGSLMG